MAGTGRTPLTTALRTPTGMLSVFLVAVLLVLAVVGPIVWGERARTPDVAHLLEGASPDHLLGTDNLGRDMFARIMTATRLSLVLAVLAVLLGAVLGVPFGALTSVLGARAGRAVASIIEFMLAFPALLLAIFLGIVLGVGAYSAVIAIGVASAPAFARLTQTLAAGVARADYVSAARILGVSRTRILVRHVLPNIAEPLILNITLAIGYALLTMSGLSFIGLGVQPPGYDWGRLLDEALDRIYVTPEAALGPAFAIVIAGLAFNGLGESLAAAASTRLSIAKPARLPPSPSKQPEATGVEADPAVILHVEDLHVTFPTARGSVTPVRGVTLSVRRGEIVGIVGESASGKSLTALAIARLVPYPGTVSARRVDFAGHELERMSRGDRNHLLGTSLAMVFQDPGTSMNPAVRIGPQLAEISEVHGDATGREAMRRAVDRLRQVHLSNPRQRVRQFPHELSGGMRQRAMIAMGLMGKPALIIADEPTSALDVTVQQQILRLLRNVRDRTDASALFISHDIAVVSELCDRVVVMYAGRIVEELSSEVLATAAAHPYTRALIGSIPHMDTDRHTPLSSIQGRPPDPAAVPPGCPFAPRCPAATYRCEEKRPELESLGPSQRVACWHPQHLSPPERDQAQFVGQGGES